MVNWEKKRRRKEEGERWQLGLKGKRRRGKRDKLGRGGNVQESEEEKRIVGGIKIEKI
jgi:hypothetical protein